MLCGAELYTAQRSCPGPADRRGFSKEKQDRKDLVIPPKKHQHIPPGKQLRDGRQRRLPKAAGERADKYHVWKFQLRFCSAGYNHAGGGSQPCQELGALLRRDAGALSAGSMSSARPTPCSGVQLSVPMSQGCSSAEH